MNIATFIRLSGLVAIIAGILNVLSGVPDQVPESALPWVRRVADIAALIALIGIYLYQRKATGTFGLIAFIVALTAVLMLIFSFNYELAIMIYGVGLILLAIAALRANTFPRWVPSMWIIAPQLGIGGFLMPNLLAILTLLATIAFALGFIGVGYHLFTIGPTSP